MTSKNLIWKNEMRINEKIKRILLTHKTDNLLINVMNTMEEDPYFSSYIEDIDADQLADLDMELVEDNKHVKDKVTIINLYYNYIKKLVK